MLKKGSNFLVGVPLSFATPNHRKWTVVVDGLSYGLDVYS